MRGAPPAIPDIDDPPPEVEAEIEARVAELRKAKRRAALAGCPEEPHGPSVAKPDQASRIRPNPDPPLETIPDTPITRKVREQIAREQERRKERDPWQFKLAREAYQAKKRRTTDERLLAAAESLAPDGGPLSLEALASRSSLPVMTVSKVRARLRAAGRYRWPNGIPGQKTGDETTPRAKPTTLEKPSMTVSAANGSPTSKRARVIAEVERLQAAGSRIDAGMVVQATGLPMTTVQPVFSELRKYGKLPPARSITKQADRPTHRLLQPVELVHEQAIAAAKPKIESRSEAPREPSTRPEPAPATIARVIPPAPVVADRKQPGLVTAFRPLQAVLDDFRDAARIVEVLADATPARARRILALALDSIHQQETDAR